MPNLPYVVYGTVTKADSSAAASATVTARNETTNETTTATTNSSGKYQIDIANLSSGYLTTDRITVYCYTQNEYKDSSFLVSADTHLVNLSLATIADTETIYYCSVQDVWDYLGKTSSDISAARVVDAIQRAESEIEEVTHSAWRSVTVTDEYLDFNQDTAYRSSEQMRYTNVVDRHDFWNVVYDDSIKLGRAPIISVTSLSKNAAGASSADSWTALTEQSGSGGDFIVYHDEGIIRFVDDIPRYGKRAIKVTYVYGHSSIPKAVERLTVLLAVRDIVLGKLAQANFDSPNTISVDGLTISGGMRSASVYLDVMNKEIDRLWNVVGNFSSVVV